MTTVFSYHNLIIAIVLSFCSYAIYTDLKYSKIRNTCSYGLIYAGVIAQMMFLLLGETEFRSFAATVITSGAIAFALYWFGILSPGDGKLFWGVSMMLPPSLFKTSYAFTSFPPIVLFVNIFIVYFCFALIYILSKTSYKQKKAVLRDTLSRLKPSPQLLKMGAGLLYFIAFLQCIYYLTMKLSEAIDFKIISVLSVNCVFTILRFTISCALRR